MENATWVLFYEWVCKEKEKASKEHMTDLDLQTQGQSGEGLEIFASFL